MDEQIQKQAPVVDWFHRKWHRIFMKLDKQKITQSALDLAKEYPNEDKAELARRVVKRTTRRSAAVGLATASPALIPGIGTAISVIGILPEEYYLMRLQCIMVLKISAIYGFDVTEYERLYEIITLVGTPSKSIEVLMVAKYDLRRMAAKAAVHLSSKSGRKALIGLKTASRGAVRRLPAIGFLAGGAINYYTINSLGKKALRFYGHKTNVKNNTKQLQEVT